RAGPGPERRGGRARDRRVGGGLPGEPAADLELDSGRPGRALDRLRLERGPGLAARHDEGPERGRSREGARRQRAEGPPRPCDLEAARAREARDRALLLREPDASRDRRGAGRDRVARVAAPHESGAAAEVAGPEGVRGLETP